MQLLHGDFSTFIEQIAPTMDFTAGNAFLFTFLAEGARTASQALCHGTNEFTLIEA
jgi:hypothetical protein